jgi:hypothetical protein
MYADGSLQFCGGRTGGLQHVKTLLESSPYSYVQFEVTTAHREADENAVHQGVKLTDLNILNDFDEIWFFGIKEKPSLTDDELRVLGEFMGSPNSGGVLVTGDHRNLGFGLAGQITRAGEMRRYPAPNSTPSDSSLNSLIEGPDENKTFDESDQSDDRAQTIRCIPFPLGFASGRAGHCHPHPVLSGLDGPIDVLPDHGHEGEALAPEIGAGNIDNWPEKDGYRERPYVIAKGKIKDPDSKIYCQEFGLISAYNGHNVDVGRIIADSSWHHWFDNNLHGVLDPPSPYAGFDDTPQGKIILKKIEGYFLNTSAWLAPPKLQKEMRNTVWWAILWTDPVAELSPDAPLTQLGQQAIVALRQHGSICAVTDWIMGSTTLNDKLPPWKRQEMYDRIQLFNLPLEEFVAGGILRELLVQVGPADEDRPFPDKAESDDLLDKAIEKGTKFGLNALAKQATEDANLVLELSKNNLEVEVV